MKDFTFEDVQKYRSLRAEEMISPNTIDLEIAVLRAFYNWLLEKGIALSNPTRPPQESAIP